jgi:hypothetical protein
MIAALLLLVAALGPGSRVPPTPASDAPPPPATAVERSERIELAMAMIHGGPSPGYWRALGPEAVPDLEAIARDRSALPSRRARALEGLSFLGGDRAVAALRELSAAEGLPFSVRSAAIEGVGRTLPAAELSAALRPVLRGAAHPAERAVAAEVLADRAPSACGAVRARVAREAAHDRGQFGRALSRCAALGR